VDENPYESPSEEHRRQSPAAVHRNFLETVAVAIIWTFNVAIVGFILLFAGVAILAVIDSWRLR
jgi:hypothetical protein